MIDPKTGDYIMENGAPVPSESLVIAAFYGVRAKRGQWLHAPDKDWGSDFHLVRKRFNGRDLSPLKNVAERAVKPLLDDARAKDILVEVLQDQQVNRNTSAVKIHILDNQGQVDTLELPPIGG